MTRKIADMYAGHDYLRCEWCGIQLPHEVSDFFYGKSADHSSELPSKIARCTCCGHTTQTKSLRGSYESKPLSADEEFTCLQCARRTPHHHVFVAKDGDVRYAVCVDCGVMTPILHAGE